MLNPNITKIYLKRRTASRSLYITELKGEMKKNTSVIMRQAITRVQKTAWYMIFLVLANSFSPMYCMMTVRAKSQKDMPMS